MLTIYIVCLLLGGALLVVTIFGGDADLDADVGDVSGEGIAAAARFMSLRNVVFSTAFFGLTGTLFTLLGVGALITVAFSAAFGIASGALIHQVMTHLERTETGELSDSSALQGAPARVLVGIGRDRSGKIAVEGGDRTIQLVARLHGAAEAEGFRAGDEVVVIDIHDGIAKVAGPGFLH